MATAVRSRGRESARRRPRGGAGRDGLPARDRLLATAAELAPQRGYESLQVGEIAAAAGVSRQTFYAHFADKRQCVCETCEPRVATVERQLREASAEGGSWAAPLLTALDATLSERFSSPDSMRSVLIETMLEMVARHGYAAVRLGAVIERAGMNQRTFYNHFAGKEQCFVTAVAELIAALEREARGSLELLVDRLAGDPRAARILLVEIHALPELGHDARTGPRSFTALVERLAFDAGAAPDPDAMARRFTVGALIETLRSDVLRGGEGAMLAHAAQWRETFAREGERSLVGMRFGR